jgi:hypothetical protein
MIVYLGVFFTTCVILGALTFDFSRLANLKAELQTSADAGAHRGALRMVADQCFDPGFTLLEARNYALMNLAMQGTVTVDAVEMGDWNPATETFTLSCVDAIRVRVSRPSNGLFMSLLGVSPPTLRAEAIGYACPVPSQCPTAAGIGVRRAVLVR